MPAQPYRARQARKETANTGASGPGYGFSDLKNRRLQIVTRSAREALTRISSKMTLVSRTITHRSPGATGSRRAKPKAT